MCSNFCRLYDWLQESHFPNLRNFPFEPGEPVFDRPTLYEKIQEPIKLAPPQFRQVSSFNYEAALN